MCNKAMRSYLRDLTTLQKAKSGGEITASRSALKMVKLCRGKRFQSQPTASPPSLSSRHCARGETAGMSLTSQLEQAEIYLLRVEMSHLSLSHKKNDLSCQGGIGTCGCSPSFRIFLFLLSTPGGGCQVHCHMLIPTSQNKFRPRGLLFSKKRSQGCSLKASVMKQQHCQLHRGITGQHAAVFEQLWGFWRKQGLKEKGCLRWFPQAGVTRRPHAVRRRTACVGGCQTSQTLNRLWIFPQGVNMRLG